VRSGPYERVNAKELSFLTVMLEKILESPLYNKEIKPVNLEVLISCTVKLSLKDFEDYLASK